MLKTHLNKRITISFLPFLFLIFSGSVSYAQEKNASKIPFTAYILQLEKKFEVKFSYADADIKGIVINPPEASTFLKILTELQNKTLLKIDKISSRYYAISKPSVVDICGTVLDNFETNSVYGASIKILESDTTILTDAEGSFSFSGVPSKALLEIRYPGYKPKFILAEHFALSNPCTTILMVPNVEELEEVTVYQFLTTGLSKTNNSNIVLRPKDFGILPGLIEPDVLQSIQALPGIKSIDETVSDINIRGGTNDQNLILWDGIKVYQSGHFFGLISAFNPYLTEKVTIIKNGTSAQYGDGVSGVIRMLSDNTIADNIYGGAGFNLIHGDAYAQIPLRNNLAFQFSARRSVTDFLNTPTYNQFFNRVFQDSELKQNNTPATNREILRDENFFFYDFTAKLLYDINEQQKVRVSFLNINNNLDYVETDLNSGERTLSFLDQTNFSLGGSLESQWTDRFSSFVNTYYTRYNLDSQSIFPDPEQELDQRNEVFETAFKVRTDYRWTQDLHWLNGYQFNEVGITNFTAVTQPPFNNNTKGVIRTHAFFSEAGYVSKNGDLNARLGARLNYIENLGTFSTFFVEPRININYAFAPGFSIEALGEFKSQTTNQVIDLEQNFLGVEKRRWLLSNGENLPITKSRQASVGVNYDRPKIYIGIEGFYKEVTGVSTATQGFQNQDQFNGEIGSYDVKGVEFLINKKTNDYSAWLSYTYNMNDYTFDSIVPISFPNNLDIRHTVTFAGTYTLSKFKLSLGINYRSGKPFTEPNADNPIDTSFFPNRINYNEPNSSRLPEYLRIDASAIYAFNLAKNIKATAGASILNLSSKKNILNTYFRINDAGEIETIESVSLGLTPNLSFRINF